jgi:anti-sigma factor RsiW
MSAPGIGSCAEMETLLAERASGPLEAPVAAALDKHLLSCARCRAAAERWETLFSLVALPAPKLKEEAAMHGLPQRALLAWQRRELRRQRVPAVAAAGLLAAAALLLVLWHSPAKPEAPLVLVADSTQQVQLEWTDGPTWEMDESDVTESTSDDATLLDGLAFEGDGAFSFGDSG